MVTIPMLWLPIILASVFAFIASAIIWMALKYHKSDWRPFPNEAEAREALRKQNLSPGQYCIPYAKDQKDMQTPEMVKKLEEGPVAYVTIAPRGKPEMGKMMGLSLLYNLVISFFVAYLAGRLLPAGSEYLAVFRVAGTVAVLGYVGALFPQSIWFRRPWRTTAIDTFDGVVYGLLTAGTFGWLWPR